jgi:hypothetical protein
MVDESARGEKTYKYGQISLETEFDDNLQSGHRLDSIMATAGGSKPHEASL